MAFDEDRYLQAFIQSLRCACTGCQWMRTGTTSRSEKFVELARMVAAGKSASEVRAAGKEAFPDTDLDAIEAEMDTCPCGPCTFYREREAAGVVEADLGAMAERLPADPAELRAIDQTMNSLIKQTGN